MAVNRGYQLRFYEQDPTVKFAVEFLLTFPDAVQERIGGGLSQIAVRDYKVTQLLKSLGKEKILALYALQKKRRAYDQIQTIHQTMAYLLVLPDERRREFASQVSELTTFVYEYMKDCEGYNASPQLEVLEKLITLYLQQGSQYVSMFIKALRGILQKQMAEMIAVDQNPEIRQSEAMLKALDSDLTLREQ